MRRLALLTAALVCAAPALAQSEQPTKDKSGKIEKKDTATLKVGDAAPVLSIDKWVKGNAVSQFESGKVYVVEFWATWCGPCIASMPHLTELQKEYASRGVTIIGVTTRDDRGNSLDRVEEMVSSKGDTLGYTVAWDQGNATKKAYMKAANQSGIPCSFVVDKSGKVAYIGHPKGLDMVLGKVVDGTWNGAADNEMTNEVLERLWSVYGEARKDPKAAKETLAELDAKYPALTADMDDARFAIHTNLGEAEQANKTGTRIVEHLALAKNPEGLNAFAWNIVRPDSQYKVKDYALAMKAAQKANELSGNKNAAILDTVARCYFVQGDRKSAIEWQKKAIAALTDEDSDETRDELENSLREYEKGSN